MKTKKCVKCQQIKPLTEFRNNKALRSGKHSYCKQCAYAAYLQNKAKDPDHYRLKQRAAILRQQGCTDATAELLKQLCVDQQNRCAICGDSERLLYNGRIRNLTLDHCHTTGLSRGLLCSRCNTGIANLNENIAQLERAITYLKKHRERHEHIAA